MELSRLDNSEAHNPKDEMKRGYHELVALSRVSAALSGLWDLDAILRVALDNVLNTMEGTIGDITRQWGAEVKVVATRARPQRGNIGYHQLKEILFDRSQPFLLLFGTGWGLTEEVIRNSDYILAPIEGSDYNHHSVRSAAAIILDRLLGHR